MKLGSCTPRQIRAVNNLMAPQIAAHQLVVGVSYIHFIEPPLALLEQALDAAEPRWREDPLAYQRLLSTGARKQPDWVSLAALRVRVCQLLDLDPTLPGAQQIATDQEQEA